MELILLQKVLIAQHLCHQQFGLGLSRGLGLGRDFCVTNNWLLFHLTALALVLCHSYTLPKLLRVTKSEINILQSSSMPLLDVTNFSYN